MSTNIMQLEYLQLAIRSINNKRAKQEIINHVKQIQNAVNKRSIRKHHRS